MSNVTDCDSMVKQIFSFVVLCIQFSSIFQKTFKSFNPCFICKVVHRSLAIYVLYVYLGLIGNQSAYTYCTIGIIQWSLSIHILGFNIGSIVNQTIYCFETVGIMERSGSIFIYCIYLSQRSVQSVPQFITFDIVSRCFENKTIIVVKQNL